MRNVNPAAVGLNRCSSCTILDLSDCMVLSYACHPLLIDNRMSYIIAESEADTSAASRLDEVIHRSCVECVLSVDELRVKHNISLLR